MRYFGNTTNTQLCWIGTNLSGAQFKDMVDDTIFQVAFTLPRTLFGSEFSWVIRTDHSSFLRSNRQTLTAWCRPRVSSSGHSPFPSWSLRYPPTHHPTRTGTDRQSHPVRIPIHKVSKIIIIHRMAFLKNPLLQISRPEWKDHHLIGGILRCVLGTTTKFLGFKIWFYRN